MMKMKLVGKVICKYDTLAIINTSIIKLAANKILNSSNVYYYKDT